MNTPGAAPRPGRRRTGSVRRLLLATAVFVVALELVLQLGAVGAWLLQPRPGDATAADVLCIGDSYTWGIGSTDPSRSYPGQLAARLRDLGKDARVHNGGTPGEDSAHVLRVLPGLLHPRTRVVCVLLGTNDSWSHPAPVAPDAEAAAPGGFMLRWRTGRLLALLARFATGTWQQRGDAAPTGEATPSPLHAPAAGLGLLVDTGLVPARFELPVLPNACPTGLQQPLAAARAHLQVGDAAAALAMARQLAATHAAVPQLQQLVAEAAMRAGDTATADAALAALAAAAAAGDATAAEARIGALLALERLPDVVTAARQRLAAEPRAILARQALLTAAFVLGDWDTVRAEAPPALAVGARLDPAGAARLGRQLARALASQRPAHAAILLVAATLLDGDAALSRGTLHKLAGAVPADAFDAALAHLPAAHAPAARAFRELLASAARADDSAWTAVLREHLRRIDALVRHHGARTVLLTYPFHQPAVETVQREVAAELGLPCVDLRTAFDAELAHRPRSELFVADGHCNDAGYALIATLAAPIVAAALSR